MCMNNLSTNNLFSGLSIHFVCYKNQIYIVMLKNISQQLLPMDAAHSNLQHHKEGHQPGKAEGLDLFEKAPMLHPGPGQATASFCTESSRLDTEEVSASSCLRTVRR